MSLALNEPSEEEAMSAPIIVHEALNGYGVLHTFLSGKQHLMRVIPIVGVTKPIDKRFARRSVDEVLFPCGCHTALLCECTLRLKPEEVAVTSLVAKPPLHTERNYFVRLY